MIFDTGFESANESVCFIRLIEAITIRGNSAVTMFSSTTQPPYF